MNAKSMDLAYVTADFKVTMAWDKFTKKFEAGYKTRPPEQPPAGGTNAIQQ